MQTRLNHIGAGRFDPATGVHDDYWDKWEIGYFDVDPHGQKLFEPLLGVRVNGGTWITADALTEAIQAEKDARHLKAISDLGESNADD